MDAAADWEESERMGAMLSALKRNRNRLTALTCGWACLWLSGCLVSPGKIDERLIARYQRAIQAASPQRRAGREGLELLRPLPEEARPPLKVVKDPLTGEQAVELSLEQAVRMAMAGSPDIRVVSFDPAILREDMVQAAAAFDLTVFGGINQVWTDESQASTFLSGQVHTTAYQVGARKTNILGGQGQLKWDVTRTSDETVFSTLSPRYESVLSLEITQPLLRTAGKDYNLSALRLAQIGEKTGYAQFRQRVEEVIAQVEQAYWTLVQARGYLEVQLQILRDGEETLRKVEARAELDARLKIEVEQTRVAVEQRRAEVIRFRKSVADVEDALARLVGDPRLNLLTDYRILPADAGRKLAPFLAEPIDQLIVAMRHNPVLEQARLAIDAAQINVRVARNETLPAVNLTGSVGLQGLEGNFSNAVGQMRKLNFIDYSVGMVFEYPWGNRAAEAKLRQSQFQQLKSVSALQSVADQVALNVNEAIRQINTNYEEIGAQERVIQSLERNLEGLQELLKLGRQSYLSVLQLILQQQDALGFARRTRIQAIVDFRNAQARLAQLTGTILQQHEIRLIAEEITGAAPAPVPAPAALPPASGPATLPTLPASLPR